MKQRTKPKHHRIDKNIKRLNAVNRMYNTACYRHYENDREKDVFLIDTVLDSLYNKGDKKSKKLKEEILLGNRIKLNEQETERLWDILINSGLVNPLIGFGNSGKLDLSKSGYKLMHDFGSYLGFLEQQAAQQQAQANNNNLVFPQFIIQTPQEGEGEQE